MSNYFRVLKRLERERTESVASAVTPMAPPKAAPPTPAAPAMTARSTTAAAPRGIATLLDNIRALASGRPSRMLVFAGVSAAAPVGTVTDDLATHAERQGMRVRLADLRRVGGRAVLQARPDGRTRTAHPVGSSDESLSVDLDGGGAPSDLQRWLEHSAPGADLVIVAGPPLGESIDAALLATACDGLIIVAESEVTERTALQAAAERARVSGCRTLGVVMLGTQDRMPAWMHRLMGSTPPPPTQLKH